MNRYIYSYYTFLMIQFQLEIADYVSMVCSNKECNPFISVTEGHLIINRQFKLANDNYADVSF
jgi:hypothetical protein